MVGLVEVLNSEQKYHIPRVGTFQPALRALEGASRSQPFSRRFTNRMTCNTAYFGGVAINICIPETAIVSDVDPLSLF
jgi:hypothetical protein